MLGGFGLGEDHALRKSLIEAVIVGHWNVLSNVHRRNYLLRK